MSELESKCTYVANDEGRARNGVIWKEGVWRLDLQRHFLASSMLHSVRYDGAAFWIVFLRLIIIQPDLLQLSRPYHGYISLYCIYLFSHPTFFLV